MWKQAINRTPVKSSAAPLAPRGRPTYELGCLFGPTGCGKTSTAHEMVDAYVQQGGKVWAIDPSRAWVGVRGVRSMWYGTHRLDDLMGGAQGENGELTGLAAMGPGLVVFDDADAYMRPGKLSQARDDWMTCFRHYRKDILLIGRRPQGVPKDAIGSAAFFCLYPGSLTEPGARSYLREALTAKMMKLVPEQPFTYLYLHREGGVWTSEQKKVRIRPVVMKSDKPA